MTVEELITMLEEIVSEGNGNRDVVIPSPIGGSYSVTDVESEDEDFLVRLS